MLIFFEDIRHTKIFVCQNEERRKKHLIVQKIIQHENER